MTNDENMYWLLNSSDSPIAFWRDRRYVYNVADLYKCRIDGVEPDSKKWVKAEMDSLDHATYSKKKSERYAAWVAHYASKGEYRNAVWESLKVVKKLKNYGVSMDNETLRGVASFYNLKIK